MGWYGILQGAQETTGSVDGGTVTPKLSVLS